MSARRGDRESRLQWRFPNTITATRRATRSGACQPAVGSATTHAGEIANRKQARTRTAPGAAHVGPPWRSGIALAKALPQSVRRLPALQRRASLPMRYPNHGGLTGTAPVASVRPPAQFRLLRCRNAYTPRAAGVSPPWGDNAHATAFTSTPSAVSETIPQARSHARPTTHGGLTPTALWSSSTRLYTVKVAFPPANERRT